MTVGRPQRRRRDRPRHRQLNSDTVSVLLNTTDTMRPTPSARPPSPFTAGTEPPSRWRWATSTATATPTSPPPTQARTTCRCCSATARAASPPQPDRRRRHGPVSVAVGDFDGDGKPDLATANFTRTTCRCCWATGRAASPPPPDLRRRRQPRLGGGGGLQRRRQARPRHRQPGSDNVSVLLGDGAGGFAAARPTPGHRPVLGGGGRLRRRRQARPRRRQLRREHRVGAAGRRRGQLRRRARRPFGATPARWRWATSTATASPTSPPPTQARTPCRCCWATARAASPPRPTSPSAPTRSRWRWATSTATATPTSPPPTSARAPCRCCWATARAASPAAGHTAGATPYSVAVGDFDGDGNPDLATANASSSTVSVLLGERGGVASDDTETAGRGCRRHHYRRARATTPPNPPSEITAVTPADQRDRRACPRRLRPQRRLRRRGLLQQPDRRGARPTPSTTRSTAATPRPFRSRSPVSDDAPTAGDDSPDAVGEDSGATTFTVLATDTDAESDAIEITDDHTAPPTAPPAWSTVPRTRSPTPPTPTTATARPAGRPTPSTTPSTAATPPPFRSPSPASDDAPTAGDDSPDAVGEDSGATTFTGLANDTDAEERRDRDHRRSHSPPTARPSVVDGSSGPHLPHPRRRLLQQPDRRGRPTPSITRSTAATPPPCSVTVTCVNEPQRGERRNPHRRRGLRRHQLQRPHQRHRRRRTTPIEDHRR